MDLLGGLGSSRKTIGIEPTLLKIWSVEYKFRLRLQAIRRLAIELISCLIMLRELTSVAKAQFHYSLKLNVNL